MEILIIILFVLGCALLVLSVAFTALSWSTLKAHREAMRALTQHLTQRRLTRVPPQDGRQ